MAAEPSETQRTEEADMVSKALPPIGTYTNFMRASNTRDEFVIEFGTIIHGTQLVALHTKLISSPTHTKRLVRALQENIRKYETAFGPIPESDEIRRETGGR